MCFSPVPVEFDDQANPYLAEEVIRDIVATEYPPMLKRNRPDDGPYSEQARETITELDVSSVVHHPRTASGSMHRERTHDELVRIGGK